MALFHLANTLIRRRPEPFNPEIFPNSCEEGRRVRLFSKPTKYCWGAAFVSQVLKQSTTNQVVKNNRALFPRSLGGQKSKTKISAGATVPVKVRGKGPSLTLSQQLVDASSPWRSLNHSCMTLTSTSAIFSACLFLHISFILKRALVEELGSHSNAV